MNSKRKKTSNFADRLRYLLDGNNCYNKKITYDALVKATDCGTRQSISNWVGGTLPNVSVIEIISEYFGVTTDYLLGYDDVPYKQQQEEFDVFNKFGFTLDFYMTLRNLEETKPHLCSLIINMLNTIVTVKDKQNEIGLSTLYSIASYIKRPKATHYKIINDFQISSIRKMLNSCKYSDDIKDLQDFLILYFDRLSDGNIEYEDAVSLSLIQTNLVELRKYLDLKNMDTKDNDLHDQDIQNAKLKIQERHKDEIESLFKEFKQVENEQ